MKCMQSVTPNVQPCLPSALQSFSSRCATLAALRSEGSRRCWVMNVQIGGGAFGCSGLQHRQEVSFFHFGKMGTDRKIGRLVEKKTSCIPAKTAEETARNIINRKTEQLNPYRTHTHNFLPFTDFLLIPSPCTRATALYHHRSFIGI